MIADDDHAVLFWRAWASRGERRLEDHGAMAFKIDGEGRFSESWFMYRDQAAYNAFYS
ncbi:MAG: hypothetical protein ACRDHM_04305 [Actinomycetota bacterium]